MQMRTWRLVLAAFVAVAAMAGPAAASETVVVATGTSAPGEGGGPDDTPWD